MQEFFIKLNPDESILGFMKQHLEYQILRELNDDAIP